jgi:hypothetical protein
VPNNLDNLHKYLSEAIDDALERVSHNLATMKDSRGNSRRASGRTAEKVISYNNRAVKRKKAQINVDVTMPSHLKFIDEGIKGRDSVKPHTGSSPFRQRRMPNINAISRWIRDAGLSTPAKFKNRRRFAGAIAAGILKQGIEAVPVYSSVFNMTFYEQLEEDLANIAARDWEGDIDEMIEKMVVNLQATGIDVRYKL